MYRKDMPRTASGIIRVCCWTLQQSTVPFDPPQSVNNMAYDIVCGEVTKKKWDADRNELMPADLCPVHQAKHNEQQLKAAMEMDMPE